MAARLRTKHQEDIRAKIKSAQLINFLQAVATTGKDTGGQEVNAVRIQAAKILLDKSVSNAPTELMGKVDSEITVKLVNF